MVFFPNTLEETVAANLPDKFKAKRHNEAHDCVLDMDLLGKVVEAAAKKQSFDDSKDS